MSTFVCASGHLWHWYVLEGNHVLAQGVAKTHNGAQKKADRSRSALAWELDGELLEA